MANVATLALREQRRLDEMIADDFLIFVAIKSRELNEYGYNNVPCYVDHEHWWRNWYDDEKAERHKLVREKWQRQVDKKYEFIWEQQMRFAAARERVMEAAGIETVSNTFFVTLRPDCSKCTFRDFFDKVKEITERKAFPTWTLSFEQKGMTDDELGHGFHCHIVVKSTCRSRPEIARALMGTYDEDKKKWLRGSLSSWINDGKISAGCIDVQVCKNPKETILNYLVNYESKDGHKAPTKTWDEAWRRREGLQPLFTSDAGLGHLPIKTNRQMEFV